MSKKLKIRLLFSGIIIVIAYLIYGALKDDVKEIKEVVHDLDQHEVEIAHIEFLDKTKAIAFYEHSLADEEYFGEALIKKNIFGWKLVGGGTGQVPEDFNFTKGFSSLKQVFPGYTDLLGGKILDPKIKGMRVVTQNEEEYLAEVIEYGDGERFWFLVTDKEDLVGATVVGMSSEGDVPHTLHETLN